MSVMLLTTEGLSLDRNSSQSLRLQLVLQFRDLVQSQRLKPGQRLPSTRRMAQEIGVARKTIVEVYDQLIAEGYCNARPGAGTFVSGLEISAQIPVPDALGDSWIPEPERSLPLSPGRMDPDLFPRTQWARCAARGQKNLSPDVMFCRPNGGYQKLREGLAEHVWAMRGIKCAPEQIIITSGLSESLRLICRSVLKKDMNMIVEDPGYKTVDEVLYQNNIHPIHTPIDTEGLDYQETLASHSSVNAIFVASTRHYPMGYQLSARRRRGLMNWTSMCNGDGIVIEDDYDCEFRFEGPRRQAIFAMDQTHRTFYLGSLSKTIFPRLRISFMIAPKSQVKAIITRQNLDGSNASVIAQSALAEFISFDEYSKHLRHMRRIYMARYKSLFSAFQSKLGDIMTPIPVDGGFHFSALFVTKLPFDSFDEEIATKCNEAGVGVFPLSEFSSKSEFKTPGLVIGFAGNHEAANLEALTTLENIVRFYSEY